MKLPLIHLPQAIPDILACEGHNLHKLGITSEEDFLLYQSVSKYTLVLVMINNNRLLAIGKTWGMDSTFKIVPEHQHIRVYYSSLINRNGPPFV
ncbi:hypothetical protein T08_3831, partial [Trichinella sp. T8]